MRFVSFTILLVGLTGCAPQVQSQAPAPTAATSQSGPGPQIVTSGRGEARVAPDRASISIGVQSRAQTAAQAAQANARLQRAVIDTLRAMGIPEGRITTINYSVSPEQVFDPQRGDRQPRVVGYIVDNTVLMEVHDLARVPQLIDGSLAKGANEVRGLRFHASRAPEVRREALASAMSAARADAEALATAAGGRLGELLEASTTGLHEPPMPMLQSARGMAADVSTPISPGEQEVVGVVIARWRFIPGR